MQTIQISDSAYKEILSRRIGKESLSKTIIRSLRAADEKWDVEKLDADISQIKKTSTYYSFDEVFADVPDTVQ